MADGADDLQFEQAEMGEAGGGEAVCEACRQPIAASYFTINDHVVCPNCRVGVVESLTGGAMAPRVLKAAGLGLVAAFFGSLIYFAVGALTGMEFSLIAILVGWMVGTAVRHGSGGRGGWVFQTLAICLTYASIVSTNIPLILRQFHEHRAEFARAAPAAQPGSPGKAATTPAVQARPQRTVGTFMLAVLVLFLFACALPFLAGFQNLIGLLIIFFGLYQAWQLNKRPLLVISGPHSLVQEAPSVG